MRAPGSDAVARFWRTDTATPAATQVTLEHLRQRAQLYLCPPRLLLRHLRGARRLRLHPAGSQRHRHRSQRPLLVQRVATTRAQARSPPMATAIPVGCNQPSQVVRPAGPVRSPHHSMALPPQRSRFQRRPEFLLGSPARRAVRPVEPAVPRRPERSSAPGWFESLQRPLATQPTR